MDPRDPCLYMFLPVCPIHRCLLDAVHTEALTVLRLDCLRLVWCRLAIRIGPKSAAAAHTERLNAMAAAATGTCYPIGYGGFPYGWPGHTSYPNLVSIGASPSPREGGWWREGCTERVGVWGCAARGSRGPLGPTAPARRGWLKHIIFRGLSAGQGVSDKTHQLNMAHIRLA